MLPRPKLTLAMTYLLSKIKKVFFYRIQVKTSQAVERKDGNYSVVFNLPLAQLENAIDPEVYYVFATCRNNEWAEKIIIPRATLYDYLVEYKIGTIYKQNIVLYFAFRDGKVFCSNVDMTEFINNFENFPTIEH